MQRGLNGRIALTMSEKDGHVVTNQHAPPVPRDSEPRDWQPRDMGATVTWVGALSNPRAVVTSRDQLSSQLKSRRTCSVGRLPNTQISPHFNISRCLSFRCLFFLPFPATFEQSHSQFPSLSQFPAGAMSAPLFIKINPINVLIVQFLFFVKLATP